MTVTRYPDWEARLAAYLDTVRYQPFEWGRHDCALFVANAVKAMTGHDFGRGFRGKYRSAAGASRIVRVQGYADLSALMTAKLGEPVPPSWAQRGDVVMSNGAVGIAMGMSAFFVGEEGGEPGLVMVGRREWSNAWRVPHG